MKYRGIVAVKNLKLGAFTILLAASAIFGGGCHKEPRGVETGAMTAVHDERWHYDQETTAQWRCDHPWEDGSYVSKLTPAELKNLTAFAQSGKDTLSFK